MRCIGRHRRGTPYRFEQDGRAVEIPDAIEYPLARRLAAAALRHPRHEWIAEQLPGIRWARAGGGYLTTAEPRVPRPDPVEIQRALLALKRAAGLPLGLS